MEMWRTRGDYLHHRLTKLYSDTKQSYESAKVVPTTPANVEDNPDVIALRKDFTIQQDRLLAWGMHWADVGIHAASSYSKKGQDVNIDKKIDQAGLGDLVASVMQEIKRLLDETGKLQHPERYEMAKKPLSPRTERKTLNWKEYEVTTGRVLLDQLKSCIDVLYSLIENQKQESEPGNKSRSISVDEVFGTTNEETPAAQIFNHSLYIDFASLAPMHDPDASSELPSYDDVQDDAGIKARAIYYYPTAQAHVIVDLVSMQTLLTDVGPESPLQQLHKLSDKLSGQGLLSWDGHLRLLGFTLASGSSRFGLVYALPAPRDQTALQKHQSLTTTINSSYDHDTSIPPLENKFRLAYNISLLVAGHLARNSTHGYINPSNVLFLRENENTRHLGDSLRCPYLLQPIKKVVGIPRSGEVLQDSIYHHSDADEVGYGNIAAHDVYSVGLVLLEIGLWMPIKKFWKAKYDRSLFSERLRKNYSPKLASKCGTRYMKAVQKCLDAPSALADKPGTLDAAEYLLQAVKDLVRCCALDEDEQPSGLDVEVFEALIMEQKANLPADEMTNTQKAAPLTLVPVPEVSRHSRVEARVEARKQRIRNRRNIQPGPANTSPDPPALKKFPEMPIPQQHLNEWNTLLMPRLSRILNSALKGSDESASVSLMMLGPTPEQAKTTICIQCTDTAGVRDMLCKRFRPKRGWGVIIVKGEVRRSGRRRTKKHATQKPRRSAASTAGSTGLNPDEPRTKQQEYQKQPGPGASIGAFKDGEHLPPVSFGGTILVDGEIYGLTVHHMLDDSSDASDSDQDSEEEEEEEEGLEEEEMEEELEEQLVGSVRRSMAPKQSHDDWLRSLDEVKKQLGYTQDDFRHEDGMNYEGMNDEEYDSESDASTIRPDYSMHDEDGNEFWFMDDNGTPGLDDDDYSDFSDEDDDASSVGDTPGIEPFTVDEDDLCVTQPAIDDVDEDFFPSFEDRDDDHLTSHSFGHIHASSGIKRVVNGGLKHEIDWALIRINEDRRRLPHSSRASSRARQRRPQSSASSSLSGWNSQEPQLTGISSTASLPNTTVTCIARTSGPSRGRISPAMALVKFHGRTSFSSSYTVDGGFGVPGDSGAWIWSEERNELCGHVLAWGNSLQVAFMAPMEVLIEDIRRTLDAGTIQLPATVGSLTQPDAGPKMKGKQVFEVVEGHFAGQQPQPSKGFEPSRDLEAALAGLRMKEQPFATDARPNPAYLTGQAPSRRQPTMQQIDINPMQSASSSASSGFARPSVDNTTERDENSRTRKERFDIHVTSGGNDLQSLPMARALS